MTISPTSPSGRRCRRRRRASSRRRRSGSPIEPGLRSRSGRLNDAIRATSPRARSPRAPCSRTPPRSRAGPRPASPRRPRRTGRSVEASNASRSGWCSIAAYIVGTPRNVVTRSRCDDLERLAGVEARQQRQAARRRATVAFSAARHGRRRGTAAAPPSVTVSGPASTRSTRRSRRRAQVAVRELGALRRAGRARRVEDHGGVGVVAVDDLRDRLGARRAAARTRRARRARTRRPRPRRPRAAASANWCQANSSLGARSPRGGSATSRSLSSGFIGTTTAPSRSAPK